MDRTRFSFIAHRHMRFCCPVSESRAAKAIGMLELPPDARIIDFGAGKCTWLAMAAERWDARCTAIEPALAFADEARAYHAALINRHRLEVLGCSASDYQHSHPEARFQAALCVGSSHAFGGYAQTLNALRQCVVPGGSVIVGEGFWKRRPDAEYLAVLGGDESEFASHAGNIERAIGAGWLPLWCCTSTDEEWDDYEWGYSRGIESFVRLNPDDPDVPDMVARSRPWRDGFIRWGRDTLGFGLYVLRRL